MSYSPSVRTQWIAELVVRLEALALVGLVLLDGDNDQRFAVVLGEGKAVVELMVAVDEPADPTETQERFTTPVAFIVHMPALPAGMTLNEQGDQLCEAVYGIYGPVDEQDLGGLVIQSKCLSYMGGPYVEAEQGTKVVVQLASVMWRFELGDPTTVR